MRSTLPFFDRFGAAAEPFDIAELDAGDPAAEGGRGR